MKTNDASRFVKDVYFIQVSSLANRTDYLETDGPCLFTSIEDIPYSERSFLLQDDAILHCFERVISLDFIKTKRMPIEIATHQFDEITYDVDHLKVKALMMTPYSKVNRIVVYLRGGKGQVGRVRAARLMQFANEQTLVVGPIIEVIMVVKVKMSFIEEI